MIGKKLLPALFYVHLSFPISYYAQFKIQEANFRQT